MLIREYKASDENACLDIFKSNCPQFFDQSELKMFINWLDHQSHKEMAYSSPAYSNSEKDAYYVIELHDGKIAGCGGFYILKDTKEARLAWGMIHCDLHRKGYGAALYRYRRDVIKKHWPLHTITLGTSQHTYAFYEKMGMNVISSINSGYGPELDRYDMREGEIV
jgi:N-acetylglutamate synthase-like GNAT family acetyltransferase